MPLVWVTIIIAVNYNLDTTVARAEKVVKVAKEDIMVAVVVLVSATKSVKPSVNRPVIITGRDSSDMISIVVPTTITMTTMTTMMNDE
mmetsp:Transcript_10069/g.11519  ORF Transcript_10069/g.11519 Transcript_10069/m.11519 type:complete len:88 (+) Transcript_10069:371-634(+)